MYNFITKIIILPISSFLAQVGGTPDTIGILLLIAITFVVLGGATLYFIDHKKKTSPNPGDKKAV